MASSRVSVWIVGMAVWVSACGGKLLTESVDASSANGAIGTAPDGPASSSSGGSSGAMIGGSSTSGGGAIAGSSSGTIDSGVACRSALDCTAGTICCGTIQMTTGCQFAPCPSSPIGPLQLCASSAECTPGETCGPIPTAPTLPVMICDPN